MKRSPLSRKTPLTAKSGLKRTPFKAKRNTNKEWGLMRLGALNRSNGYCEAQWEGCQTKAAHVHHIRRRSQGGKDQLSNLLAVCAHCHHMIHTNVAEAAKKGHLITNKC